MVYDEHSNTEIAVLLPVFTTTDRFVHTSPHTVPVAYFVGLCARIAHFGIWRPRDVQEHGSIDLRGLLAAACE